MMVYILVWFGLGYGVCVCLVLCLVAEATGSVDSKGGEIQPFVLEATEKNDYNLKFWFNLNFLFSLALIQQVVGKFTYLLL